MHQMKLYSPHDPPARTSCLAEKKLNEASFLSKQHYLENRNVIYLFKNSADPNQLMYKKPADQDLFYFIHWSYAGNLCKHFRA